MTDSTTTVDVPGYKAGTWVLDPSHSEVTFSLRHMMISKVRGEFGVRPNAEVTAWISLVEALIHFYSQPGPKALDRLKRAHALSRAMNHPVLVPLCAAWLAQT